MGKYIAACLLAQLSGKTPDKENITAILESIGAEVEDKYLDSVLEKLKGQSIDDLIAAGSTKMASVPSDDDDDDDDEVDLFGSDSEEDEAAEEEKQKRLKAYQEKKAKKPAVIAKSSIVLDVKPWDDETDMNEVEKMVRGIELEGLVWGASKLVAIGYGIKKLQIGCVVEDDKVGTDILEEKITGFEDHVQSMDVAAFQKI